MSLFSDVPYDEFDWQTEVDAVELREIRELRRQPEDEIATSRPCCNNPANCRHIPPTGTRDLETGYEDEAFYECSCGSRIAESDYACVVRWFERQVEPEAVPVEIDERTRIEKRRIA